MDEHDGKPKRKASAKAKAPAPKRAKIKNPLPVQVSESPPLPIDTDLSGQKCSYHECANRAKVVQSFGIFCNRHAVVFPCGFPGCREKAPTNGTRCAKHEHHKLGLDEALSARSQSIPVCRTTGCFKNDQGRGYCRGHEKLMMATGQLPHAINKRRLNSAYTMCCYPHCNKHSQRNHLCRIHGNELIKQAQAFAQQSTTESFDAVLQRLQRELRRCTHPGCEKNAQRDRLCTTHFHMKDTAEKGLPKTDLDNLTAKDKVLKFCSDDKCTQPVYCNWLCKQHYEQKEKKGKHAHNNSNSSNAQQKQPAPKKKPTPAKKPALNDDLFTLTPPLTAQAASMVELLYPPNSTAANPSHTASHNNNNNNNHSNHSGASGMKDTPVEMAQLHLDEPTSYGHKKDIEYRHDAHKPPTHSTSMSFQQHNSFARPTYAPRYAMGYDYLPGPHATNENQSFNVQEYGRHYPTLLPPSTRLCASAGCNRDVTSSGKSMCDVCLSVLTQVHAFSPTIHPFGTHTPSYEPSSHKPSSTSYASWPQTPYFYAAMDSNKNNDYYTKPKAACRFRGCQHTTKLDAAVCAEHAQATFCTAAACEEVLSSPGLCGLHAMDNQCCYENCAQSRLSQVACVEHEMAAQCTHHQCAKFAAKGHSVCSMHLKSVVGSCKLCLLYDVPCALATGNENVAMLHHNHASLHSNPHASGHKLSF
ncbi:hypothetical protein SPRG_08549 [Saprolegnia parasitica CBS 223.65]|uniref:Uncharacterized protein n=1 Tax=Saprolegnia parasitica (strain CBS 223.65) TaxID=695850 RepID=A0A067CHD6_SAPPC|nr:hypothetical protein SPRG_08549 [Saprolegnia parasitica CBS 223.65]KDO26187.1 hypothetical protein SPRG_08549 [Saprolegnia parasitica CBS 223.65]|eukprot:XP_012203180.1 hypothetical protein SPRG_08549 [Saprolegnia parasitica CBS 223.65]